MYCVLVGPLVITAGKLLMFCSWLLGGISLRLIQAATVKALSILRLELFGTLTRSSAPSKLRQLFPATQWFLASQLGSFTNVPVLPLPLLSLAVVPLALSNFQ